MKSSVNFSDVTLEDRYITPSELIELSYCPRFIYYMNCLDIPQYEKNRYLVQLGNEVHKKRTKSNKKYLSKKMEVLDKYVNIEVSSDIYKLKGKIDELLFLNDKEAHIVDYKNSAYKNVIYKTLKLQMTAYAVMVQEKYNVAVKNTSVVFLQNNKVIEISIGDEEILNLKKYINEYHKILKGFYPKGTTIHSRCSDCCYRNICIL